tara:strand:+ start:119 stop:340 length:222 start_codon:yes stop_codon:yes gene_type:complete
MSKFGRLPLDSIRGLHDGRTHKKLKHVAVINDNLVNKKKLVCIFKKILTSSSLWCFPISILNLTVDKYKAFVI